MSHDWRSKLEEVETALSAQNERWAMVKETLADLPGHTEIAFTKEWQHAFEDAVVPVISPTRAGNAPPLGAIRG